MRDLDKKILKKIKTITVKTDAGDEFTFGLDGFNPNLHQVLSFYIGHVITNRFEDQINAERMEKSALLSRINGDYECLLIDENMMLYKDYEKLSVTFYPKTIGSQVVKFETLEDMHIDLTILTSLQLKARAKRNSHTKSNKK